MFKHALCYICLSLSLLAISHAQSNLLDTEINLDINNASLKEALTRISQSYQVPFTYADDILPEASINGSYKNQRLSAVLNDILTPLNIGFQEFGGQIILFQVEPEPQDYYISGFVTDSASKEALIGVTIYFQGLNKGIVTNHSGYYSIKLPEGKYAMNISYVGYHSLSQNIELDRNIDLNIDLSPFAYQMDEIIVRSVASDEELHTTQMNTSSIDIQTIRQIPSMFGEDDAIRNLTMLPGISSNEVNTSNFYIRGGSSDQTMFQMDGANVFDVAHFGGFFSIFNPDLVKNVDVYKGNVPAHMTGGLSSLINVDIREGNKQKWSTSGSLGLLTARATVEGPIKKDHTSIIVAARRTYVDGLIKLLSSEPELDGFNFYFYDLNLKINSRLNAKNNLEAMAYIGKDLVESDDLAERKNKLLALRWNHIFSPKMFSSLSASISSNMLAQEILFGRYNYRWQSDYSNMNLKLAFTNYFSKSKLNYGLQASYNYISPSSISPVENNSVFESHSLTPIYATKYTAYAHFNSQINDWLSIDAGLRANYFFDWKKSDSSYYDNSQRYYYYNSPDSIDHGIDYSALYFEPSLYFRFRTSPNASIKLGYNYAVQPLHQIIYNQVGIAQTRWHPASDNFRPEWSHNFSLGFYQHFAQNQIKTSIETYYRKMGNLIETQQDERILLSSNPESLMKKSEAWSTGLEVSLSYSGKKNKMMFNYSLSWVEKTTEGVNLGKPYHPMYDSRHRININNVIFFNKRMSLSALWTFASGQPYSQIVGKYELDGLTMIQYDNDKLNSQRLPAYHRLDISLEIASKKNDKRKWQGYWNFSIYNLYTRKNALGVTYFSVNDDTDEWEFQPSYLYFYQFVPSISYRFKF